MDLQEDGRNVNQEEANNLLQLANTIGPVAWEGDVLTVGELRRVLEPIRDDAPIGTQHNQGDMISMWPVVRVRIFHQGGLLLKTPSD